MKAGDCLGEYTIVEPISVGKTGQADIYRARRPGAPDAAVAVKVLAQHLRSDPDSIQNFVDEAELLTKLDHPNIVRLEAFDTSPPTPYIAQEYIEGQSVADLLAEREGPLPIQRVAEIALQIADALTFAHDVPYFRTKSTDQGGMRAKKCRGVVHCDLSSDNILIATSGQVKLIDFGIARAAQVTTVTRISGIGKEYYAAPEVELGDTDTPSVQADIYSFGVCLYEMLMTGRPERERVSVLKQFHRNYGRLSAAFPPEIPLAMRKLIEHCVQREPASRPRSINEARKVIRNLASDLGAEDSPGEAPPPGRPDGLSVAGASLTYERTLALDDEYAGDASLSLSVSAKEDCVSLLCGGKTKVVSFNISGGERQTSHIPGGNRLAAVASHRGGRALGLLESRAGLLRLDQTGDWHEIHLSAPLTPPQAVPDHAVVREDRIYLGDYGRQVLCQVSADDGRIEQCTPAGKIALLGAFASSADGTYCIDALARTLLRAGPDLQELTTVAHLDDLGWATSLASGGGLLFVLDSQFRRLSVWTGEGRPVDARAVSWSPPHEITQVLHLGTIGRVLLLDPSAPAIHFFRLQPLDLGLLALRDDLMAAGVRAEGVTYEAVEDAVLSALRESPSGESLARTLLHTLASGTQAAEPRHRLQVVLCTKIPSLVDPGDRQLALRKAVGELEALGACAEAEEASRAYFAEGSGFDPETRDRYGRLLERRAAWEEILGFEKPFLDGVHFMDDTKSRAPYEASFQRLRRAYAKLGVPLPRSLRVVPTEAFGRASALFRARKHEEARTAYADLIDEGDYKRLGGEGAVRLLTEYACCIKRSLHQLTAPDWREVDRALTLLLEEYAEDVESRHEVERDREAARMQAEKLEGGA